MSAANFLAAISIHLYLYCSIKYIKQWGSVIVKQWGSVIVNNSPTVLIAFHIFNNFARRIMFKRIQFHLKSWRISPCGNKTGTIYIK